MVETVNPISFTICFCIRLRFIFFPWVFNSKVCFPNHSIEVSDLDAESMETIQDIQYKKNEWIFFTLGDGENIRVSSFPDRTLK